MDRVGTRRAAETGPGLRGHNHEKLKTTKLLEQHEEIVRKAIDFRIVGPCP